MFHPVLHHFYSYPHSIGEIIAFDKGVSLVSTFVLGHLYKYLACLDYMFVRDGMSLSSTTLT